MGGPMRVRPAVSCERTSGGTCDLSTSFSLERWPTVSWGGGFVKARDERVAFSLFKVRELDFFRERELDFFRKSVWLL